MGGRDGREPAQLSAAVDVSVVTAVWGGLGNVIGLVSLAFLL